MVSLLRAVTGNVVDLRAGEGRVALLMFGYSFLAMASYNILRPLAQSKFIDQLGAENLPWVLLAAGLFIGVLMHAYSSAMRRVPRRFVIPATQLGIVVLLLLFWGLFRAGAAWATVAFYVLRLVLGILLISQFWTLANDIYDARQAKRLFGFIGAGASLGGTLGAVLTLLLVREVGTNNLLLVSAAALAACAGIAGVVSREQPAEGAAGFVPEERGVGGREALRLLLASPHIRMVALVIGLAAAGGAIVDQQLSMAAQANHTSDEAIAAFLAQVMAYVSLAGFVVQLALTSRIHRSLGLMFALLLLPVALGSTAVVILVTGSMWAAGGARILDATLRYTVDKTTREVLFLPIPAEVKFRAKPFIDVTVDRVAKAATAVLLLALIQPWGLGLDWRRLSYASLTAAAVWIGAALAARREYLRSFRAAIGTHAIMPAAVRVDAADAATLEALVEELSNPDETAVLYAIDMLEALDKRNLVTPLLLHHDSPRVRVRALLALHATRSGGADRWIAVVTRMLKDEDADVRAAAMQALGVLRQEDAAALMRRCLDDPEPRVAVTAAIGLADSQQPGDADAAAARLARLVDDRRDAAAPARRDAATALGRIRNPWFRPLLVPLLADRDPGVAGAAIASAKQLGAADGLFVPALVARLGDRRLKRAAREALVGYGVEVLEALGYLLADRQEQTWIRRHLPATIALIPSQRAMDILVASLGDPDGFLRYKVLEAIETLHRAAPELDFPRPAIEAQVQAETSRYCMYLTLRHNILAHAGAEDRSLLVRALDDKLGRSFDRLFRLLGLLHAAGDVHLARRAIEQGDARRRAAAFEYLDNLFAGAVRRRILPLIEDGPPEAKARHANIILGTRPRDVDDTLAQLVHDDDPVVAASAIWFVLQHRRWALADDLDYVVSRRSADQPVVAEAAVWALASRGREAPSESAAPVVPLVELAERLRRLPPFARISVDELFRICAAGRQVCYPVGHQLYAAGVRPEVIFFLLAGSVASVATTSARDETLVEAPAALAFDEALIGAPLARSIRAAAPVVCFAIERHEFLITLAHSAMLAQGLFEMLLDGGGGALVGSSPPAGPAPAGIPARPIERMFLLRQHAWLEGASVEQLAHLSAAARDVPLVAGRSVFREGDAAAVYQLVDGEVQIESDGAGPVLARAGSAIGLIETLAGTRWDCRATATQDGHALRLDRDALVDVLEDDAALMDGIVSRVVAMRTAGAAARTPV